MESIDGGGVDTPIQNDAPADWTAAPIENSPEASVSEQPYQYEQDTGYVPNSRDLGVTAQQASEYVAPTDGVYPQQEGGTAVAEAGPMPVNPNDVYSQAINSMFGSTDAWNRAVPAIQSIIEKTPAGAALKNFGKEAQQAAETGVGQAAFGALEQSGHFTEGALGQVAGLDDQHREMYNREVYRQLALGKTIGESQWEAGQKTWREGTQNPQIGAWDVPVKQALTGFLDPSNLAFAGAGEASTVARAVGGRLARTGRSAIRDIVEGFPEAAGSFADSMGMRQSERVTAGRRVPTGPEGGGADAKDVLAAKSRGDISAEEARAHADDSPVFNPDEAKAGPFEARGNSVYKDGKSLTIHPDEATAQAQADKMNARAAARENPKKIADVLPEERGPVQSVVDQSDLDTFKELADSAANGTASVDDLHLLRSAKTYANSLEAQGQVELADKIREAIGIDKSASKAYREATKTPGAVASDTRVGPPTTPIDPAMEAKLAEGVSPALTDAQKAEAAAPMPYSNRKVDMSKPTYGEGTGDKSPIVWENKEDKAIYTVTNRSGVINKSHAEVYKSLLDRGLTDEQITARGKEIRDRYLKPQYRADPGGELTVPVTQEAAPSGSNLAKMMDGGESGTKLPQRAAQDTLDAEAGVVNKPDVSTMTPKQQAEAEAQSRRARKQAERDTRDEAQAEADNATKYNTEPSVAAKVLRIGREMGRRLNAEGIANGFANVFNIPRAMEASTDLSASLSQGAVLGAGHPKRWAAAMKEQFRSIGQNLETWQAMNAEIVSRSEKNGLGKLFNREVGNISKEDEEFGSTLAQNIPGFGKVIQKSDQAFSGFLNHLGAGIANDMVEAYEAIGAPLMQEQKDRLASFINHATGRGGLPKGAQGAATVFNSLFFSPRYLISRLQVGTDALGAGMNIMRDLAPALKASGGDWRAVAAGLDPVDREIVRSVGSYLAANDGAITMLKLLPGVVAEDDPTAVDYGRIRLGRAGGFLGAATSVAELFGVRTNSTEHNIKDVSGSDDWTAKVDPKKLEALGKAEYISIDPWGGMSQDIRLAARLIEGKSISRSGKVTDLTDVNYGERKGADLIWDFTRGKFAPGPALLVDLADRQDMAGNKLDLKDPNLLRNPLIKKATPIGIQNIAQNMDFKGELPGLGPQGSNIPGQKMGKKAAPEEW